MPTHVEAIQMVLDALVNEKSGVIKSLEEVDAIGHRVLHGGMKITNSVIIDDEVIKVIEECADLGPLHLSLIHIWAIHSKPSGGCCK